MGSLLRYCRAVSVRALLVPALLALAWLVWGAGSAQASTDPSDAAISETALNLSLPDAPSLPAVQVLPAGQDRAGSAAHHIAPAADAVAPVASTVTTTAAPVVSAVSQATAPAVATVTRTAAPVVSTVDHTVAAVDDAVASAVQPLPLPAVKLPQLPILANPVATVPTMLPAVESAGPASPVPDVPVTRRPSGAVYQSQAAAVRPTAQASSFAPASARSGAARPAAEINLAAIHNTDSPFKTLAQLRMTASARPLVSAVQAPPLGLLLEQSATEQLHLAVAQGGGSSGSNSSGAHAADIAAAWNGLSPAAGALAPGASVAPPSGPAVDPGSSPD